MVSDAICQTPVTLYYFYLRFRQLILGAQLLLTKNHS